MACTKDFLNNFDIVTDEFYMGTFRNILREKLQEVHDFPRENIQNTPLPSSLLHKLYLLNVSATLPLPEGELPKPAHFYREKLKQSKKTQALLRREHELQRRFERKEAWSKRSSQANEFYTFLTELGEWDFSPTDKSALKKAFHRLLLRFHPDIYKGEDGHSKTRKIIEAFDYLLDDAQ